MTARTRKQTESLFENRDPKMERMLTQEFKVDFEFLSGVSTSQIDVSRSEKANTRLKTIDEDTKKKYIADLGRGDKFPPIIGYYGNGGRAKKITVADGRHRVAAHQALGRPLDVYLLDPNTPAGTIVMIAYLCNEKNGLPYTDQERIQHAIYFVDNDVPQKEAAARFGVSTGKLKHALDIREANNRADEAGVNIRIWEGLHPTARARLNGITTDEIFKGAATLAHDARLSTIEVQALVVELRQTKVLTKQREILAAQRRLHKERIQSTAGGMKSSRGGLQTPKTRFAVATSLIVGMDGNVDTLAKAFQGEEREEAAEQAEGVGGWYLKLAEALRA